MTFLAVSLLVLPQVEPLRMDVLFAGGRIGESRYERLANGRFKSVTQFSIGATRTDTTIEGQIRDGRIVRYRADGRQAGERIFFDYNGERLISLVGGMRLPQDYDLPDAYTANYHPQLASKFLLSFTALAPGVERKSRAYFLDSGLQVAVAVRARKKAIAKVEGRDEAATQLGLVVENTELEYSLNDREEVVAMDLPGQRLRFVAKGWESLFADEIHPELSQPTSRVERSSTLRMRTRDGITLVSDMARPLGRGRFPAILERTPYGRANAMLLADYWASRGYVYVAQDCRGRGDSGGAWDPFVNEGKDGYDAVGWVARQPWCDGNVGMIGSSYAGAAQWQAAIERPPALRCIVPQVSIPDAMHNLPFEYGTFLLSRSLAWTRAADRKKADSAPTDSFANPQSLALLPVGAIDKAAFGRPNPIFQSWIRRPSLEDWSGFDHISRLAEAQVPALHVSGWFDGDGIGTKLAWEAMRRAGRKDQWLVYGPWTQAFNASTRLGDLEFGPTSRYDLDGLTLRFMDTYLKGMTVGMEETPRVQAFLTGANRWLSLDAWPSPDSTFETLYLAPNALVPTPGANGAAIWNYDPAKDTDVAALRGGGLTTQELPPKGTYVLFKGEPLTKPTTVTGPFEVRLFFKSSAKDTDLFATFLDIAPGGKMRPVGQPGKLRASYRESLTKPTLLEPGRTYTALLRPWDAAHELAKGHRLALLVRSSLFPTYARNLGTGESLAWGTRSVPQRNVILTGTVTPSRITFRKL